ncbi:MAG: SUMF1/EgtB/PvdO family nonheme iron enzyme [Verrucomicrobia bacterium]|nr:SUMF1/EgtB/PvdO family nonheme iron enzyme [Verrucomicrobiota bacterium]
MKIFIQSAGLLLVAVLLLVAGCGEPEVKLPPATPDNAVEARNQMRTARSQIKSSAAPYLQEMMRRGDGLEKSGGEAMEAKNYTKALRSFAEARKCYQQAVGVEADMEAKRAAALSAKKDVETARPAANAFFKTEARPESFVTAEKNEKEADEALAKEDFEKARKLFTRAVEGYKAAQAEAEKLIRVELSRAAQSAKKDAEAARSAANVVTKPEARPESFVTAEKSEKEANEALAKEEFAKARELFDRAASGYTTAQADGKKLLRDENSRVAYAKKKEAEAEYLTANTAFKTDARSESFVTAGNCMKEGEAALAQEDFAKARELYTRALAGYKTAQTDAVSIVRAETSRVEWTRLSAAADAALLERQAPGELAKVKSQAESAAGVAAKDPGQAAKQFAAATATLKALIAQAKTKENLPKSVPVAARLENALRVGSWLQAQWTLGELGELVPDDPRMTDFRAKAAALPWPKEVSVDIGGGVMMNLIFVGPGSFPMGEGNEKHQVTLTKPFYMGKFEVTQQQWQAVMGSNPSSRKYDKNPVENISWDACQSFVAKLNGKLFGVKVSLPTEAQWEYACRAGSTTKYCFGEDGAMLKDYAWFPLERGWHSFETHPVGTKKPNAWGFHDMHGNVAEFCSDWYGPYPTGEQKDPKGPDSGSGRVLRGGSSRDTAFYITSASRREVMSVNVLESGGLRLVLVTDAMADYQPGTVKLPDMPSTPVASTPSTPPPPPTSTPTASSTTSATPAMTTTAPVPTDAWMNGLPPRALPGYLQARSDVLAGKGLMAMRSWRAMWGNRLRDPTRGYAELEFTGLLLTDPSKEKSAAAEEQKKQQNLKEAAMIVRSIRARGVTDGALLNQLEETAKKLP